MELTGKSSSSRSTAVLMACASASVGLLQMHDKLLKLRERTGNMLCPTLRFWLLCRFSLASATLARALTGQLSQPASSMITESTTLLCYIAAGEGTNSRDV